MSADAAQLAQPGRAPAASPHPALTRRCTGVAEQNTSAPSSPRPADAAALTGTFARELERAS